MDEDIEFINLFSKLQGNQDERERREAENIIQSNINQNPMQFIYNSIKLFLRDDVHIEILKTAVVLAYKTIKPNRNVTFSQISSTYLYHSEYHQALKEAIVRALCFDDEAIIETAALMISIMVKIEKDSWLEIFDILPEMITCDQYSAVTKYGAMCSLSHILDDVYIPANVLERPANRMIELAEAFICPEGDFNSILFIGASRLFGSIISNKEVEFDDEKLIYSLSIIEKGFSVENEECICSMIHLLWRIFERGYQGIQLHFSKVFDLVNTCMETENDNIIQAAIEFWNNILVFEYNIEKDKKKKIHSHDLSKMFSCELFQTLSGLLCTIPEECINEYSDPMTYDLINDCLSHIFLKNSEEIFEIAIEFISEHITSTEWKEVYSAISVIESMCRDYHSNIGKFLVEVIPTVFDIMGTECPILIGKALGILINAAQNYKAWMNNDEIISKYIDLLIMSKEAPVDFVKGCSEIMKAILEFDTIDSKYNHILNTFDQIYEVITAYRQREDLKNVYEVLNAEFSLIQQTPTSILENFNSKYSETKERLIHYEEAEPDVLTFTEDLLIVAVLAQRKLTSLLADGECLLQLFTTMLEKHLDVYDTVLIASAAVVGLLNEAVVPILEYLVPFAIHSFESLNSEIISANSILIEQLFISAGPAMGQYVDPLCECLINVIKEQNNSLLLRAKQMEAVAVICENYPEGSISSDVVIEAVEAIRDEIISNYTIDAEPDMDDMMECYPKAIHCMTRLIEKARATEALQDWMPDMILSTIQSYKNIGAISDEGISFILDLTLEAASGFGRAYIRRLVKIVMPVVKEIDQSNKQLLEKASKIMSTVRRM